MDKLIVVVAFAFVVSVFVAGLRAITRWRGPGRAVAALATLVALGWEVSIVVAIRRDPTSHNLWPIESVMIAGGLLTALVTIALMRSRRSAAR